VLPQADPGSNYSSGMRLQVWVPISQSLDSCSWVFVIWTMANAIPYFDT
jgi:hypothetical protein